MLLCIDIGNTSINYGVFKENKLTEHFRMRTNIDKTYDEYGMQMIDSLRFCSINHSDITGVIISSVVPRLDNTFENISQKYFKVKPMLVAPGIKSGLNIKLDNPRQLGADILVGAVAAKEKYNGGVIVIDMGTAMTFVVVTEKKELLGGIIIPGIKTAFNGLFKNAAKVEEVKIDCPENIIGKDTITSVQSGMVNGYASMIDGLIKKIKKEHPNYKVILTGGEGRYVIDYLEEEVEYDDDLLLKGLEILYNKNK